MVYNFLFFFIKVIVLFCIMPLVSTSHSSSSTINLAAFLNSHLQLATFQEELSLHSLIFKYSHQHLFLFHLCLLLQNFSSNKQTHLQLS